MIEEYIDKVFGSCANILLCSRHDDCQLDYPAKLATIVKLCAPERLVPLGHLGANDWEKIYIIWLALRCGWEYEVNNPFGEYDESNRVDAGPANAKPVDATSGAYSGAGHVVGTFTGVDR